MIVDGIMDIPIVALFKDIQHAGGVLFGINGTLGWLPGDIRKILGKFGIEAWGFLLLKSGELVFKVPKERDRMAYKVLVSNQVPVLYPSYG